MSKPLAIQLGETGEKINEEIRLVKLLKEHREIGRELKDKTLKELKEAQGIVTCMRAIVEDEERIKRVWGRLMEGIKLSKGGQNEKNVL